MTINPLTLIERLIEEHGSSTIQGKHLALPSEAEAHAHDLYNLEYLSLNSSLTEWHIYDALTLYDALYRGVTPLMMAFRLRFLLTRPDIGTIAIPGGLPIGCDESVLAKMSNRQFYDAVMPILN